MLACRYPAKLMVKSPPIVSLHLVIFRRYETQGRSQTFDIHEIFGGVGGGGCVSTGLYRVTKLHLILFFCPVDGQKTRLNSQEVLRIFVRMRITEPTIGKMLCSFFTLCVFLQPYVWFVKYCWKEDKFYISPICRASVWYIGRPGIRIPVGERDFLLLQKHLDRLWGSHEILVAIGSFPGGKSDGACGYDSPPSCTEAKNEWSYCSPLPVWFNIMDRHKFIHWTR